LQKTAGVSGVDDGDIVVLNSVGMLSGSHGDRSVTLDFVRCFLKISRTSHLT